MKAAALVVERAGYGGGLHIEMSKQIPMGAGLGGGSSDAAATIVGLNDLLRLGWSRAEMAELGLALGSDVPFFFAAPSAIVEGRGETVVPTRVMGQRCPRGGVMRDPDARRLPAPSDRSVTCEPGASNDPLDPTVIVSSDERPTELAG